jgi:hypothetical protein
MEGVHRAVREGQSNSSSYHRRSRISPPILKPDGVVIVMTKERDDVLSDIETRRHQDAELDLEAAMSINDWMGRLQGAAKSAHGFARAGLVGDEYQVWIDVAQIAVARAEFLLVLERKQE